MWAFNGMNECLQGQVSTFDQNRRGPGEEIGFYQLIILYAPALGVRGRSEAICFPTSDSHYTTGYCNGSYLRTPQLDLNA